MFLPNEGKERDTPIKAIAKKAQERIGGGLTKSGQERAEQLAEETRDPG
jgi:hypothetical protein